jgi:hypothetical protein
MKKEKFETVDDKITKKTRLPRDKNIFYQCLKCGEMVPSTPKESMGCKCGNVFIDKEYFRAIIEDYPQAAVIKRL